jgi:hypothetical protein
MPYLRICALVPLTLFLFGISALTAFAQESAAPQSPSYLMRMERIRPGDDVCVLVRGDGQYHLEHQFREEIQIYEGTLTTDDLQGIERILDGDELFHLSQKNIAVPLIAMADELDLSIARPGSWQNLSFPDPGTRKPYDDSLAPLMKWLDELHKQKHVRLNEDEGKNNCLPPGEIALQKRGAERQTANSSSSPPPAAGAKSSSSPDPKNLSPYSLRMLRTHLAAGKVEESCLILFEDGRYRWETKAQKIRDSRVNTQVFEGRFAVQDVQQLQAILNSPAIRNRTSPGPSGGIPVQEMDLVFLNIPRKDGLQKVGFWRYFAAYRTGAAGMPVSEDNGLKLLKPLDRWLKSALDTSKLTPLANSTTTNCSPAGSSQP